MARTSQKTAFSAEEDAARGGEQGLPVMLAGVSGAAATEVAATNAAAEVAEVAADTDDAATAAAGRMKGAKGSGARRVVKARSAPKRLRAAAGGSVVKEGGTGGVGAGAGGLRLWLERARGLGLTAAEMVFDLHVRQGLPLLGVAGALGLDVEAVRELWLQGRTARAAAAPESAGDFAALREQICAALWQTVEATFPVMSLEDEEDCAPPAAPSPPMLSVRLKALDQIAKLYDVSLEQRASGAAAPLPYATPEEIADSVRERVLEMHGKAE